MIPEGFVLIPGYTKYCINKKGEVFSLKSNRLLKSRANNKRWGYNYISLQEQGVKVKNWLLHRLVMLTFTGIKEGLEINHIDGIKNNNSLDNLEWVTSKENKTHARKNGLYKDEVSVIGNKDGIDYLFKSIKEAGITTGVDISSICKMINSKPVKINGVNYYRKSVGGYVWRKSA